jgi:hypothetical protein
MRIAIACALSVLIGGEARADGPCTDGTHYRILRSAKGAQPIAIAAASDRPVYGAFTFVELNNDGKPDVVFASACVRSPADSVRYHRVYVSCGKAADGGEDFALLFEDEEPCERTVKIERQATQQKQGGAAWQDLQLTRTVPGARCEQTVVPLRFDGAQYRADQGTTQPCPKR